MKDFFKINLFKIIFTFLYFGSSYLVRYIPGFSVDLQQGMFYGYSNTLSYLFYWPTILILKNDELRQISEGCRGFCFPSQKVAILAFAALIIYAYLLSCVIQFLRTKRS